MKKWSLLALCAITSLALGKATLRQTSEDQNRTTPPPEGEMVYATREDGTVAGYVGHGGRAKLLVDPTALHLARSKAFDESELDIGFEGTMSGSFYSKGTVTITHIHKERIGRVEWTNGQEGMMPGSSDVSVEYQGHIAIVTIKSGLIDTFTVFPEDNIPRVDLVNQNALLTDSMGSVYFGDLRASLYQDLAQDKDGHWAFSPARSTVNLGKYSLLFGAGSGSAVRGQTGSISLYAGGLPALTANATNAEGEATSGTLAITDLTITGTTVVITSIQKNINTDQVHLQYSPTISDPDWLDVVSPTVEKQSDGTVIYTFQCNMEAGTGFWRLYAGDSLVSLVVTIHGDLEVAGGIILTSPNGTRYRLTISDNGTLEASAL